MLNMREKRVKIIGVREENAKKEKNGNQREITDAKKKSSRKR